MKAKVEFRVPVSVIRQADYSQPAQFLLGQVCIVTVFGLFGGQKELRTSSFQEHSIRSWLVDG
jgi:hypothetical protein